MTKLAPRKLFAIRSGKPVNLHAEIGMGDLGRSLQSPKKVGRFSPTPRQYLKAPAQAIWLGGADFECRKLLFPRF